MRKYFQAPWTFRETIFILFTTIALIALAIGADSILNITDSFIDSDHRTIFILGMLAVQWVLMLGPLFIVSKAKHKNRAKDYGIKKVPAIKTAGYVLGGYIKYIGLILILSMLVLYTNLKIPGFQAQENIIPFFGESTSSIIVAGIVAIALAPVVEEIFFRGFLLRSLSNQWGTLAGNLITAGIFALFHMQWQNIIPIFILGIIINSITIRSKSIIPSIAFHAFNNAIAFILSVLIIKDVIPIENITS